MIPSLRTVLTSAALASMVFGTTAGMTLQSATMASASSTDPSVTSSAPAGPITVDDPPVAVSTLSNTDRYILEFDPGTDPLDEASIHADRGMAVQTVLTDVFPGEVADLTGAQVKALRLNPRVRTIEIDTPVTTETTQSPVTWGLDRIDQRNLPLSSSYSHDTLATGVKAYVVDSGILASHTDFGARVTSGTNAYSGVNDGRGTSDCDGHGTHVSGTIGGTTYGVAKGVTLVPVRVLDCTGGGTASGIINGLNWVISNHTAGTPAVANLSLGLSPNDLVDRAVQATINDGVSVAVAAGNENKDSCERSPSRVPDAVTVGAVDSGDRRAYFSNFGSCVDLFAPGVSVTSDWKDGSTAVLSGTSMATPHAAGTIALLLGASPTRSPGAISADLRALATSDVLTDIDEDSPNLLLFTGVAPPPITQVPNAPTSVRVSVATANGTTVSWTRSTSTAVLDQTVNAYRNGTLIKSTVVAATSTSLVQGSLTPGASYTFTVQARNLVGLSAASSTSSAVVYRTKPNTPSSVVASINGSGVASLSWTVVADGGSPITEQTVRTYRGSVLVETTTLSGSATGFTTPRALDLGVAYKFTVLARNTIGLSSASAYSNTVTYSTAPSSPIDVVATLRATSNVRISWTRGATGGSALIGQTVSVFADGEFLQAIELGGNAKNLTLTGMSPGVAYTFTVQARNLIGESAESERSDAVSRIR